MDSLMPRSENQRVRGQSQLDFKTATTGVAAKAMRNEISNLVKSVSDPQTKKVCPCPLDLPATR
jgi:UTP--glucose-1-phosphate uridylyltransferase